MELQVTNKYAHLMNQFYWEDLSTANKNSIHYKEENMCFGARDTFNNAYKFSIIKFEDKNERILFLSEVADHIKKNYSLNDIEMVIVLRKWNNHYCISSDFLSYIVEKFFKSFHSEREKNN